ncbi:hypothetical protein, partial [Flintibacter porci]|uniref:hypothetical protein n=1 Tax=Flintibacter porci TaxID=3342383 RepID=UPI003F88F349
FPQAVTETIISLIAEVNITLCPLFYPLNVTFTFAINRIVAFSLAKIKSNNMDYFICFPCPAFCGTMAPTVRDKGGMWDEPSGTLRK